MGGGNHGNSVDPKAASVVGEATWSEAIAEVAIPTLRASAGNAMLTLPNAPRWYVSSTVALTRVFVFALPLDFAPAEGNATGVRVDAVNRTKATSFFTHASSRHLPDLLSAASWALGLSPVVWSGNGRGRSLQEPPARGGSAFNPARLDANATAANDGACEPSSSWLSRARAGCASWLPLVTPKHGVVQFLLSASANPTTYALTVSVLFVSVVFAVMLLVPALAVAVRQGCVAYSALRGRPPPEQVLAGTAWRLVLALTVGSVVRIWLFFYGPLLTASTLQLLLFASPPLLRESNTAQYSPALLALSFSTVAVLNVGFLVAAVSAHSSLRAKGGGQSGGRPQHSCLPCVSRKVARDSPERGRPPAKGRSCLVPTRPGAWASGMMENPMQQQATVEGGCAASRVAADPAESSASPSLASLQQYSSVGKPSARELRVQRPRRPRARAGFVLPSASVAKRAVRVNQDEELVAGVDPARFQVVASNAAAESTEGGDRSSRVVERRRRSLDKGVIFFLLTSSFTEEQKNWWIIKLFLRDVVSSLATTLLSSSDLLQVACLIAARAIFFALLCRRRVYAKSRMQRAWQVMAFLEVVQGVALLGFTQLGDAASSSALPANIAAFLLLAQVLILLSMVLAQVVGALRRAAQIAAAFGRSVAHARSRQREREFADRMRRQGFDKVASNQVLLGALGRSDADTNALRAAAELAPRPAAEKVADNSIRRLRAVRAALRAMESLPHSAAARTWKQGEAAGSTTGSALTADANPIATASRAAGGHGGTAKGPGSPTLDAERELVEEREGEATVAVEEEKKESEPAVVLSGLAEHVERWEQERRAKPETTSTLDEYLKEQALTQAQRREVDALLERSVLRHVELSVVLAERGERIAAAREAERERLQGLLCNARATLRPVARRSILGMLPNR